MLIKSAAKKSLAKNPTNLEMCIEKYHEDTHCGCESKDKEHANKKDAAT